MMRRYAVGFDEASRGLGCADSWRLGSLTFCACEDLRTCYMKGMAEEFTTFRRTLNAVRPVTQPVSGTLDYRRLSYWEARETHSVLG